MEEKRKKGSQVIHLEKLSMKRRKKDVRFMRFMAGITVLFLALTLLFQDNMNEYQMEMNYHSYGEWLLRVPSSEAVDNPFLERCGSISCGGGIYRLPEGAGDDSEIAPEDTKAYTGKLIGTMDSDIRKNGHIELYEGHFPEKSDEIVMELGTLQALGYDYEPGQRVSFYVAEEENLADLILANKKLKLRKVSFTLSGTLKNYTALWYGGEILPNAIVKKSVYDSLTMQKKEYTFYGIRERYLDSDVSGFAAELTKGIGKKLEDDFYKNGDSDGDFSESGIAFNEFAYSNPFWGNQVMYRNMTIVFLVLGTAILAYLMSVYLSKRRKYYFRLREIGATRGQIFHMSVYECIGSILPVSLLSLLFSYGLSILIVFVVAGCVKLPFFYVFRVQTLLLVCLSFLLILLSSFFFAQMIYGGKNITQNRNKMSAYAVRRLRRRARRKRKLSFREQEKRFRICHPVSVWSMRIIGIGVTACILTCLAQIREKENVYFYETQSLHDFTVSTGQELYEIPEGTVPVKPYTDESGEIITEEYLGAGEDRDTMRNVFSNEFIENIRGLKGLDQMSLYTTDDTHIFEWEKKGTSDYYHRYLMEAAGGNQIDTDTETGKKYAELFDGTMYGGRYYQNTKNVWRTLEKNLKGTKADYEKFRSGEQILLFMHTVSNMVDGEDGEMKYEKPDTSIKEGELLTIETKGKTISVEVGAILSADENGSLRSFGYRPYSIVGSEDLGKRIAGEDGISYGYNHMELMFNAFSDTEATDKIVTRQCRLNHLEYDSDAEYIRAAFKGLLQAVIVYGTLGMVVLFLYLFIYLCVLREEALRKAEKQKSLVHLGMPSGQIKKQAFRNGIREYAFLFPGILVFYLLQAAKKSEEWSMEEGETVAIYSRFFHKQIYELTEKKYVFYQVLDTVNPAVLGMVSGILLCVLLLLYYANQNRP